MTKNCAPKVAVVVLSYNGRTDTIQCLENLRQLNYPNFSVIVVDNASTDGSVAAIQADHPEVELIASAVNLGFSAGNNLGLQHALKNEAEYALLLNNDTESDPDMLNQLIDAMEETPDAGLVGPMIYYFDEPERIWSAGGRLSWKTGKATMIGIDEMDFGQHQKRVREVDFVTGCAAMVRTCILDHVGDLDPRFFVYYEEVEWCTRIRRNGYKILHVPEAKVWHKINPQVRNTSRLVHYYMTRNRLLFLREARMGFQAWIHTLLLDYARTLLSWSIRPKWRSMRAHRDTMIGAILDFIKGDFGETSRSLNS